MKNDYSFKLVAAIIFAGVLIALVSPSHAVNHTATASAEAAHSTAQAE